MFRRFKQQFKYVDDNGQKITIPFNWAGELPADVAKDADDAGATIKPVAEKEGVPALKKPDEKK